MAAPLTPEEEARRLDALDRGRVAGAHSTAVANALGVKPSTWREWVANSEFDARKFGI